MKKLKLKALELGAKEVLNRDQLKNVLGGSEGSGTADCKCSTTETKCPTGTKSCSVTKIGGVEKISCDGSAYSNC